MKFINFLNEGKEEFKPEEGYKILKSHRILKVSAKGITDKGYNLNNDKLVFYVDNGVGYYEGDPTISRVIVATNKDKIDVPSKWIGESADKPGYSSTHNSKLSNDSPLKIKITRKVDYKHIMSKDRDKSAKFIATPSALAILSSGHEQSDKKDETDNNDPSNGIFAIGYWDAAYGDNKEYFWIGPFKSKTDAVSSARNVMKRGPKNINGDYLSGRVKYYTGIENFKNASKKVDLNPNLDDLSFK